MLGGDRERAAGDGEGSGGVESAGGGAAVTRCGVCVWGGGGSREDYEERLGAVEAGGGGKEGGPWNDNFIQELGLDDDTLSQIKEIRRGSRDSKLDLEYKIKKAKNALKDLLSEDNPRESEVMDAVEEVGELETTMRKSRLRTMLKINALLTPEQRTKFRQFQRERKAQKREKKMKKRRRN